MTGWTITVGWTLVHFLWEGTVVALAAAVALWLLRGAPAQARYVTACAALVAALLAPIATAPTVAMLASSAATVAASAGTVSTAAEPIVAASLGASVIKSARAGLTRLAPAARDAADASSGLSLFVCFWAVGVLLLTVRLATGWWRVRRLQAAALCAPASPWLETAVRLAAHLRLSRPIHVVDSHLVDTPTVIGWLRPVVLLPVAALANLSPVQVQAILAHELAHVRRHDFVVNVLQTLAETVLFYHPAIWWLSARIRTEREHCCDDIAVEVCGDPIVYAEALTELASWAMVGSPLALAATGGSLLTRIRRLLQRPPVAHPRRPTAPIVIAATVILVLLAGVRWMVVAQGFDRSDTVDRTAPPGPLSINRMVGFELFPEPVTFATDDPSTARAWDVRVAFPGGESAFEGFTARGLVRYGYDLADTPVLDGPAWLDTQSEVLRASTAAADPSDADYRLAIRAALEEQFGVTIRRGTRAFPVLAMTLANGRLGPSIHPNSVGCLEGRRTKPENAGPTKPENIGPMLIERGQLTTVCGIEESITGFTGYRVSMAELAYALRRLPMGRSSRDSQGRGRDVVDRTGLAGDFDFHLGLGLLPLSVIATAHPVIAFGLGSFGVSTFPQALEDQLGIQLVPAEAGRPVVIISSATVRRPS
jgi:uncharacterized protein (TIGR03435 family)